MRLLNIGCGSHYHRDWTNIDIVSSSPDVIAHDIRKGLPFDSDTFDAVYHSHVIEHLPSDGALAFLKEGVRILKPGAVMRVVTPDLETIARLYLEKLDAVLATDGSLDEDYDWMILELFDQSVRSAPGGEMLQFLKNPGLRNKAFIEQRVGQEARSIWESDKNNRRSSFLQKVRSRKLSFLLEKVRNGVAARCLGLLAGSNARQAFQEGMFRRSGEIHHRLYDRYSLKRLMMNAGFIDIRACSADESRIQNFCSYGLDSAGGQVRKPDSLFMEGIKS